jgi:hypothetical protein
MRVPSPRANSLCLPWLRGKQACSPFLDSVRSGALALDGLLVLLLPLDCFQLPAHGSRMGSHSAPRGGALLRSCRSRKDVVRTLAQRPAHSTQHTAHSTQHATRQPEEGCSSGPNHAWQSSNLTVLRGQGRVGLGVPPWHQGSLWATGCQQRPGGKPRRSGSTPASPETCS